MPEIVLGEILSEELRKSQYAGDLLDAISARRPPAAQPDADGDLAEAPAPTRGTAFARGFQSTGPLPVIVEGNARVPGGGAQARLLIALRYIAERHVPHDPQMDAWLQFHTATTTLADVEFGADAVFGDGDALDIGKSFWTDQYLFGALGEETIRQLADARLVVRDPTGLAPDARIPLVHKVWLNHAVGRFVFESGRTVKCDAARAAFAAAGEGVVWAVVDTGIDGQHFHFRTHDTLKLPDGLQHMDFTPRGDPLVDEDGHGTHVAGIIAGETRRRPDGGADATLPVRLVVQQKVRTSDTDIAETDDDQRAQIGGVAPLCKLVSLKVLRQGQSGDVATLLAALGYIQQANNNGRNLRIHGVNLSLGYAFDARWFAAGQSPLCVEVDRLVRSGVVVVVAAGNSGYGTVQSLDRTTERASHLATICDPGNAELAITVGSTHRDSPHSYGISYFSAKGPTADGRMKPDLVAPGERIVSAMRMDPARPDIALFHEDTGTSMAAPHVSGAIAAFLSVRREFRGRPERVKQIFTDSATDLRRRPEFQGAGLIDAMRALQSV